MTALFYISLAIILYTYVGYPILLWLWGRVGARPVARKDILPAISILLPVYNEERRVEARIKNLLESDYPREKMEILAGCDGCTDGTAAILERLAGTGAIRVIASPERAGKPSMLNRLAREAKGEIFVFADARQRFAPGAIRELVRCFGDDRVGCASGELVIEDQEMGSGHGVGLYWRYELSLRKMESAIGSMLGATGAIYAVRREHFRELPANVLLDDVFTPMNAIMAGKRCVLEPAARAYDTVSETVEKEFNRKVRTLAGNFQIFSLFKAAFIPFASPIAWQLFSHKLLRLALPYFFVLLFALSSLLAVRGTVFMVALVAQVLFYASAVLAHFLERSRAKLAGPLRRIYIPYEFCVLNAAAVAGLLKYLSGGMDVKWRK